MGKVSGMPQKYRCARSPAGTDDEDTPLLYLILKRLWETLALPSDIYYDRRTLANSNSSMVITDQ